jgi:hypothetical protein
MQRFQHCARMHPLGILFRRIASRRTLHCLLTRELVRLSTVKRLKPIVALMMLALWVPATSHALLESAGFIHQAHADADSDDDHDHDAADGICAISSATTLTLKGAPSSVVLYFLPLGLCNCFSPPTASHSLPFGALGPSPPLLPQSWQFLYRTAIPGRAPSITV